MFHLEIKLLIMNKNFFKNKSLLLTGGTGSFGRAFVNYLLKNKMNLICKILLYILNYKINQFLFVRYIYYSLREYNNKTEGYDLR